MIDNDKGGVVSTGSFRARGLKATRVVWWRSPIIMERVVQQSVLQAAKVLEDQVDAELERMERLDEDDIERLREKRLQQVRLFLSTHVQEWVCML